MRPLFFFGSLYALPFCFLGDHFLFCVLPISWGDGCCPICLTRWVTHDPSTGMRATTSLGGERAHLTMLILSPPNGFLSRSLFHNPPLSCGERANFTFPTISAVKSHSFAFCAALWECAALGAAWRGMGKEESGGLGEKTRKGKGDCSRAAPLPPGCLPKRLVERYCVSPARRASKTSRKQAVIKKQNSRACAQHTEHMKPPKI